MVTHCVDMKAVISCADHTAFISKKVMYIRQKAFKTKMTSMMKKYRRGLSRSGRLCHRIRWRSQGFPSLVRHSWSGVPHVFYPLTLLSLISPSPLTSLLSPFPFSLFLYLSFFSHSLLLLPPQSGSITFVNV